MDKPASRIAQAMSRRDALSVMGAAAAISLFRVGAVRGADTPRLSCVTTPMQTEGPYFVDEHLNRSDVRADPGNGIAKEGVPLKLRLFAHAIASGACAPLADAVIDIWHCDATGIYSDVDDAGRNTSGQKSLR